MKLVLQNKRPQPSSGKLWLWLTQSRVNFYHTIVLCRVLQTWYSQICAVTDDFYMVSDNIRHNKYKNSRLHKKTNQADRNRAQAHTNTKNNLHI